MLTNGTSRRSQSPWSSPLHMAPKKDNGRRPCGDYRFLNARTIPDNYPIRHIQDFAYQRAGSNIFSKADLVKAFNQIATNRNDVMKTTITTPFGLFEFPYMTFGLRNAALRIRYTKTFLSVIILVMIFYVTQNQRNNTSSTYVSYFDGYQNTYC